MLDSLKCFMRSMALKREEKLRHKMCYHHAVEFLNDVEYGTHYKDYPYEYYWVKTKKGIVEFSLCMGYCFIPHELKIRVNSAGMILKSKSNKLEKMFLVLKDRVMYLPKPPKENKDESKN